MKIFMLIVVGLFIGWFSHILYSGYHEDKGIKYIKEESSSENETKFVTVEKIVTKEVVKYLPKIIYKTKGSNSTDNNNTEDIFLALLNKGLFYEAMDYYEEAEEKKQASYRTILLGYFSKLQDKSMFKVIAQMQYFIGIEAKSIKVAFQLADLFVKQNRYKQAINMLTDFTYIASHEDKNIIYTKIKNISLEYTDKQVKAKNFKTLVEFLSAKKDQDALSEFYTLQLAQVYLILKKYESATVLLKELDQSETYKEYASKLLSFIEMKLEEQMEYPIKIPLVKQGLHFLVEAYVDDSPVTLMLDTGASITTIDTNLLGNLKTIKENVIFHTAGGDISESIFQADSFSIGEVTLNDFKIAGSSYPNKNHDGLLGMNFFSKFKFKIDQNSATLLLGAENNR